MTIDTRYFNPVYWHIDEALRNPSIRRLLIYGGSSSSKTYSITQSSVINALQEDNSTLIFRKESTTINNSVYADFKKLSHWINEILTNENNPPFFEILSRLIRYPNGMFSFHGLDDPEKIKGVAGYKRIFFNELSKFDVTDWEEANRRLRGLPNQKLIADWNPIDENHWIKKEIIDNEKWIPLSNEVSSPDIPKGTNTTLCDTSWKKINEAGDTMLIKTSFMDNYWVVGSPCGKYGFVDRHTIANFEKMRREKPNQYQVYGLGEWGTFRVGGEFWKQFDIDRHVRPVPFLPDNSVHVSVDINVIPYITQTLWQFKDNQLRQFDELCARDPENTAAKAAQKVAKYLNHIGYSGVVHIYGDASGKNRSVIEKNTFFGKYFEEMRKYYVVNDRVMKNNPSVAMSAAFINDIYEGFTPFSIAIGDNCTLSKQDYNTVKEDMDGGMVKESTKDPATGVKYEKNGHISDAKRYFICRILKNEYDTFLAKHKKNGIR